MNDILKKIVENHNKKDNNGKFFIVENHNIKKDNDGKFFIAGESFKIDNEPFKIDDEQTRSLLTAQNTYINTSAKGKIYLKKKEEESAEQSGRFKMSSEEGGNLISRKLSDDRDLNPQKTNLK